MARVVVGLVGFEGFGQQERAPVGEAADYAAGAEDEGSGGAGDSGRQCL